MRYYLIWAKLGVTTDTYLVQVNNPLGNSLYF